MSTKPTLLSTAISALMAILGIISYTLCCIIHRFTPRSFFIMLPIPLHIIHLGLNSWALLRRKSFCCSSLILSRIFFICYAFMIGSIAYPSKLHNMGLVSLGFLWFGMLISFISGLSFYICIPCKLANLISRITKWPITPNDNEVDIEASIYSNSQEDQTEEDLCEDGLEMLLEISSFKTFFHEEFVFPGDEVPQKYDWGIRYTYDRADILEMYYEYGGYIALYEFLSMRYNVDRHISLSSFFLGSTDKTTENAACSICLEVLNDEGIISQLPCQHQYHRQCILEWLMNSSVCPLCRISVCDDSVEEDDDDEEYDDDEKEQGHRQGQEDEKEET